MIQFGNTRISRVVEWLQIFVRISLMTISISVCQVLELARAFVSPDVSIDNTANLVPQIVGNNFFFNHDLGPPPLFFLPPMTLSMSFCTSWKENSHVDDVRIVLKDSLHGSQIDH